MGKQKSKTNLPSLPGFPLGAEETRSRYEFILNTSRDFMTLISRSYVYEAANDAYCAAHDKTREEVIGKTMADLWGEKLFLGLIKGHLDRCFTGKEVNYQAFFAFPSLEDRYFDVTCSPYFDRGGLVSHVVVVSRDITERKGAEEAFRISCEGPERRVGERSSELGAANEKLQNEIAEHLRTEEILKEKNSMLQTLINAIPDAVFFKDTEGRHLLGNRAMEESMGLSQEELVGKSVADLSPPEVAEACMRSDAEALKAGGVSRLEESSIDRNGQPRFLDVVKAPIYDPKGDLWGLVGVARDITERKRMEEELREGKTRYHTLFDQSPDGIVLIDADGKMLEFNENAHCQLGYSREEFASLSLGDIDPVESHEEIQAKIGIAMEQGKGEFDVKHRTKQGEVRDVHIITKMITVAARPVMYALWHDITERRRTEEALLVSEKKYRLLFDSAPVGIGVADLEGNILAANRAMVKNFGYTWDEMQCVNLGEVYVNPDERAQILDEVAREGFVEDREVRFKRSDGTTHDVLLNINLTEINGRKVFLTMLRDITERKMAEAQIHQALQEKETLLRELYHRTKNNMQVITSLLNLQAKEITDKKTLQVLEDTKNRIRSMALVHEKLYKAKNLSHVSLRDYVHDLAQALMKSHNADKEQISLCVDIDRISVSIDTITPLGLVINELMTNALKYAFPDNTKGEILIKTLVHEDKNIELTFSDNGIGIPKHIDLSKSESLGLKIVRTLVVSQIKGKLEILTQNGTTVLIKFKDKDMLARI